jgi:hypothetical protein
MQSTSTRVLYSECFRELNCQSHRCSLPWLICRLPCVEPVWTAEDGLNLCFKVQQQINARVTDTGVWTYASIYIYQEMLQQYLLLACFVQKIRVDKRDRATRNTVFFEYLKLVFQSFKKIQNKNLEVMMNIWTREISIQAISSVLKMTSPIFLKLDVYRHYLVYLTRTFGSQVHHTPINHNSQKRY